MQHAAEDAAEIPDQAMLCFALLSEFLFGFGKSVLALKWSEVNMVVRVLL